MPITDKDVASWENSIKEMAKDSRKKAQPDGMSPAEKFFVLTTLKRDCKNIGVFVSKTDPVTGLLAGNRNLRKAASDFQKQNKEQELNLLRTRLCIDGKSEDHIYEEGRNSLAKKKSCQLQNLIEMAFTSIRQREFEIKKIADTSKIRFRIRKKMAEEKKKMQGFITDYNMVGQTADPKFPFLLEEDGYAGNWPWINVAEMDMIPMRVKRLVVDKRMDLTRNEEELDLIASEMQNTLATSLAVKTSLEQKMKFFIEKLGEDNICEITDVFPNNCDPSRYSFDKNPSRWVMNGLLSIFEQHHALTVLHARKCVTLFRDIIENVPASVDFDFLEEEEEESDEDSEFDAIEFINNLDNFEFDETGDVEF